MNECIDCRYLNDFKICALCDATNSMFRPNNVELKTTAKEMFNLIGFGHYDFPNSIRYIKKHSDGFEEHIRFFKDTQEIDMYTIFRTKDAGALVLNMKRLNAINRQVEELEWK